MTKMLCVAFLLILFSGFVVVGVSVFAVQGDTTVTGIIYSDAVWTRANSPYTLTGPVGVNSGVTLTIEPGVIVNLSDYFIQVNGTLIAEGGLTDPVIFDGGSIIFKAVSNDWDEQTGSGCIIENAVFSTTTDAAGFTVYPSEIVIDDSSPKISQSSNVSITVNGGSPMVSENTLRYVKITRGTPKLLNNIIKAVSIDEGSPQIFSNIIQDGIDAHDYPVDGSPVIWNNTITYPGGVKYTAIDLQFNGIPIVSNNNITGLSTPGGLDSYGRPYKAEYTGYGIRVTGNAYISNNVISGCINASILVYGFPEAEVTIQNNTLKSKGIIIKGAVSTKINYNNIEGSISLIERATTDADATYNWWGTTDETVITQSIVDSKNDFTLGKVNFTPFLTEANPQAIPDPTASTPPSIQEPEQTELATAAVVVIMLIVIGTSAGLLLYLIKKK